MPFSIVVLREAEPAPTVEFVIQPGEGEEAPSEEEIIAAIESQSEGLTVVDLVSNDDGSVTAVAEPIPLARSNSARTLVLSLIVK